MLLPRTERRRDSRKNFIQGAASTVNGGEDHDRNAGGYQGALHRRGRRLVRKENLTHSDHGESVRDAPKTFIKRRAGN